MESSVPEQRRLCQRGRCPCHLVRVRQRVFILLRLRPRPIAVVREPRLASSEQ